MSAPLDESELVSQSARWLLQELDTQDGITFASGGGGGSPFQADPKIKKAWRYLREEIHELVCTNSAKYKKERDSFSAVEKPIVLLFGGIVANHFGLEAATATGMATLALHMPFNMGRNVWCRAYKENNGQPSSNVYMDGEREHLLLMANFKSDLVSKEPKIRVKAIHKVASNQLVDKDVVTLLITSLQDADAGVRGAAAFALSSAGEIAEPAIATLVECLKDPDKWVRAHSADALGQFKNRTPMFLVKLADCLKDADTRVREEAAESLGKLGEAGLASLPALRKAFKKEDPEGKSLEFIYAHSRLAGKLLSAIRSIEKFEPKTRTDT